jgi:hypothetical protein
MQRTFDKPYRQENSTQWKWTAGIAVAFGLIIHEASAFRLPRRR